MVRFAVLLAAHLRIPGLGQAQVALNTGDLHLSQALDFDLSPGTSVGRSPALAYNSGTVDEGPQVQLTLSSNANEPVPDSIDVSFAWAGQAFGAPTISTTATHQPGDAYVL